MKKFKFIFILALLILFSFSFLSPTIQAQDINDTEEVEAYLDGFIKSQMEEYNVPGVSFSLVRNGEVMIGKGYGYYNREEEKRVTADTTLFRPGSGSKLFIWTAIMQLVEQDKIDLNDNVNKYLDFKIPDEIVGKDLENVPPITIMNLLNHNAGFEEVVERLFINDPEDLVSLGTYLKNHIPARVFLPGQQMGYSNYGSALAAYIVQRVSGLDFYAYVDENIFTPLGMDNSTFQQPAPTSNETELSYGYAFVNGSYRRDEFEYINPYPAGSLSSTASDMAKFMLAHLNNGSYNGQQILEPVIAQGMYQQSFTHYDDFSGMAHGFIEENYNGYRIISHGGDTFLFHSGIFLIPELDLGLFISYNSRDAALARGVLFKRFMDRYFPGEGTLVPEEPGENFIDKNRIVGTYYPNRSNFTTYQSIMRLTTQTNISINQADDLVYNFMGQQYKLYQIEPNVFYDPVTGNKLYAPENEDGEITNLYTNTPNVLLKASTFETLNFNIIFLAGYVIFTVILIIVLIRSLFKSYIKEKYIPEKLTAVVFGLLILGFFGAIIYVLSDIHPLYNIPYMFLEKSTIFNNIQKVLWIVPALSILLVVMNVSIWFKNRWNIAQKGLYTIYTIWSLGITWWFYYWNLLQF